MALASDRTSARSVYKSDQLGDQTWWSDATHAYGLPAWRRLLHRLLVVLRRRDTPAAAVQQRFLFLNLSPVLAFFSEPLSEVCWPATLSERRNVPWGQGLGSPRRYTGGWLCWQIATCAPYARTRVAQLTSGGSGAEIPGMKIPERLVGSDYDHLFAVFA